MGTDWKRRNDEVIPVTEIYQGDRNSYETQGGPRAALPEGPGRGSAGRPPHQRGLVQNALGVGYRMGFIASSDHYSTHISYANLIVPDGVTTREDLLEAFRKRAHLRFHRQHRGRLPCGRKAPGIRTRLL